MKTASGTAIEQIKSRLRKDLIQELSTGTDVNEKARLGCQIKFPIENVLEGLQQLAESYDTLKFAPREDVYIFETSGQISLHRFDKTLAQMQNGGVDNLSQLLTQIDPIGVVTLMSLSDGDPAHFVDRIRHFYDPLNNSGKSLTLGKGHTIRTTPGTPEFAVLDFISTQPGNLYGLANNDTIVDIDCKMPHSSWITVFTALNNSLNDLFGSGVHENIRIFPTIAGADERETESLHQALDKYAATFDQYGFTFEPVAPLGQGLHNRRVVGATVIGTTDREVPRNEYLREGQVLFATRPVGDLIPLAEYMTQAYMATVDAEDKQRLAQLEELRTSILETLITPNLEAARIIADYLPQKGDSFDDDKHITSSIDVSGPGIKTVAWLAQDSGKDVYLSDIVYHDASIQNAPVHADQTGGTNGAIIMAAQPAVAFQVMADLQAVGYKPWEVGRVGPASHNPKIYIEPTAHAKLPAFAAKDLGAYFGKYEVVNG